MRKALFLLSLLFTTLNITWAAKATPTPLTFNQPDGTSITVRLYGDENGSWYKTLDGVYLTRQNNAFFVSAFDGKRLSSSGILAHNNDSRNAIETAAISKQNSIAFDTFLKQKSADSRKKVSITNRTPQYFPHSGSPKVLVILTEYEDQPFTLANPQKSFTQFFNAEGENNLTNYGNLESSNYYSVRGYFNKMSNGLFTPDFVVVGPVKIGKMGVYGGSDENGGDENFNKLVLDAVTAASGQINLQDFDNDGDGSADLVYIIHSGYGQNNGGDNNTVWAKTGTYGSAVNGTTISWGSCASELNLYPDYYTNHDTEPGINGIGVVCHEFSHAMGLPDIYPTSSSAYADNQEMEYWDIMDAGEYVYNGYRPKDYLAWEREIMGWMNIQTLTTDTENIVCKSLLDDGTAFRFCNPNNSNEYFILENVQKSGLNKSMPGHGLIAYHVYFDTETIGMTTCPNNILGQPGMAIVPADGVVLSSYIDDNISNYRNSQGGDPFPGTSEVHDLYYDLQLPNYKWYNGDEKVNDALIDIQEDTTSGTVSFSYIKDYDTYKTGIETVSTEHSVWSGKCFNLNGQQVWGEKQGIFIINGKKIIR